MGAACRARVLPPTAKRSAIRGSGVCAGDKGFEAGDKGFEAGDKGFEEAARATAWASSSPDRFFRADYP